jgi:hypothetical protein
MSEALEMLRQEQNEAGKRTVRKSNVKHGAKR